MSSAICITVMISLIRGPLNLHALNILRIHSLLYFHIQIPITYTKKTMSYLKKMITTRIYAIQLSHVNVLLACFYGDKENSIEYSHTDTS